ncbi:MAG TPA: type IV pilus twitching motility protein PilT [Candidatus Cryosericum sp.]|jgi:twitching motility protein PilT|nr:type IV pilus twitching motility protein PilT [Candidatus Cryosericum sp.]
MADVDIRGLDDILKIVVERGASDLHLQAGTPPMLRLHKHLLPIGTETLTGGGIEALVFPIMNDDQKAVFKQHMDFDFSYSVRGLARFRVNVFRQRGTMAVTMRRIPFNIPDLDSLGLPDSVKELTKLEKGFVLVTGPTGHGKSTTLAAIIDKINQERDVHTVTVEDPVEFLFQHRKGIVVQRELGEDTESFAHALRAVLREDPDIILVGELRDLETIGAALTAAETGHLVFGTLHTNSAPQSIDRIIDVFPAGQQGQIRVQLANVLSAIVTQQLLPRKDGNGLIVATEVLIATPAVRNLIRENKSYQIVSIMQTSGAAGMMTMEKSVRDLVARGLVAPEVAIRAGVSLTG